MMKKTLKAFSGAASDGFCFGHLFFWSFGFVSNFGFRISDFGFISSFIIPFKIGVHNEKCNH